MDMRLMVAKELFLFRLQGKRKEFQDGMVATVFRIYGGHITAGPSH